MAKVQSDFYFRWAQDRIQATYTADQTLTSLIEYVGVDTTSNAVEIELPDSSGTDVLNGKKVWIIDQGDAATNNVTVIPHGSDSTTIQGADEYVINVDNQIIIFELVDDQWIIVTDVTLQLRRDFVTANNEISTSSSTFSDALQKDFIVVEDATYVLGVVYQWRHEKKDKQHRTRVRINAVENTDLRGYQFMGGADDATDLRMIAADFTLVDLTIGTYDIDFQLSSEDETAYLFYRRLYLEKWTQ